MEPEKDKVLIAIGTRPEAIKLLPLILAFQKSAVIEPVVVSSGQHSELVREVLGLAGIEPDVDLGAAIPGNTLNELFASVLTRLENFVLKEYGRPLEEPDRLSPRPRNFPIACFVHGDTSTAAAVATLAERFPDVRFVVPLHPNPKVRLSLSPHLDHSDNVNLIAPMKYNAFARLLQRAYLAITDSGGIQEEAPSLNTPVVVVRETTERQEGVESGTLELVGTDTDRIIAAVTRLLEDPVAYRTMSTRPNPYGDGNAAARIVAASEYIAFGGEAPAPYGNGFERIEVLRAAGFRFDPVDFLMNPDTDRTLGS